MQRSIEHQARRRIRRPLVIAAARLCVAVLSQPNLAYAGVAVSTAVADSMAAPDTTGYRWLGRPAVTLKVCRGDRGRDAGATSRTSQLDENDDIGTNGKPAG